MTGKDQIEQISLISMVIKPVNRPIRWAVQLGFGAAALFGLVLVKNFHLLETDQVSNQLFVVKGILEFFFFSKHISISSTWTTFKNILDREEAS